MKSGQAAGQPPQFQQQEEGLIHERRQPMTFGESPACPVAGSYPTLNLSNSEKCYAALRRQLIGRGAVPEPSTALYGRQRHPTHSQPRNRSGLIINSACHSICLKSVRENYSVPSEYEHNSDSSTEENACQSVQGENLQGEFSVVKTIKGKVQKRSRFLSSLNPTNPWTFSAQFYTQSLHIRICLGGSS